MALQASFLQAFVKLGSLLRDFCDNPDAAEEKYPVLHKAVQKAQQQNAWFTNEAIHFSLRQWSLVLTENSIKNWLSNYPPPSNIAGKTVAIIMAGNIPLVGFHDFLSVLLTGHNALCKLSSNDTALLPVIYGYLVDFEPSLKSRAKFTNEKLQGFDAVIATGSTNTSRYFEYYFGKHPHIIRKNRTSVAVLTGEESAESLQLLGDDIFKYFGLGCRNVSKIYVPKGYDFEPFFNAMFANKKVVDHHKYANNYDYNKAVYLMSEFKILDNGFMILKEDEQLHSPISVIFYETYDTLNALKQSLTANREALQCIVGDLGWPEVIAFGETQKPALNDYADGIDTVDFLLKI